ncbi:hypothetical protein LZK98_08790 [Sphingomonas cannabina]|uniref:hypothetical protein n=1 Tax=Sphingomonas cannabina TaxID=2899123 RepID=UPI001F19FE3A|nr:hypothetical protein [Sphingomonas cannabina]UIJ47023.1 hypothetical protein LZK98_08790 [Sphingomonas cannabina]
MLGNSARDEATVVERPRAGDAIGVALREAYERDFGIPDDLAALLSQLDGSDQGNGFSRRG